MSPLSWISDEDLSACVDNLISRANSAVSKAETRMQHNVVDPFSSLIIASTLALDTTNSLVSLQKNSSALSGISSALGNFHQQILGCIGGWENHDAGYDLENASELMLAEVKNKHNTMNAGNRAKVVDDLDTAIRQKGRGWVGYLVIIIPKNPSRYETRLPNISRPVYEIDGASFYTKVTGDDKALHDLFSVLIPMLESRTHRTVSDEIKEHCCRILTESVPE